jgi:hypothetical protein
VVEAESRTEAEKIRDEFLGAVVRMNAPATPRTRPSNYASTLDDPCLRRLVYWRTMGDRAKPIPPDRIAKMEDGKVAEAAFGEFCAAAGFEVFRDPPTKKGRWEDLNISGRTDRWLALKAGRPVARLVEFKAPSSPWIWRAAQEWKTLTENRWTRKWVSQLVLYLWIESQEEGLLIVKCPGAREFVVWVVKMADHIVLADRLTTNAAQVETHLRAGTLPDFLRGDAAECRNCEFFGGGGGPCFPELDMTSGAAVAEEFSANAEAVSALSVREENREAADRYDDADQAVKKALRPGIESLVKKGERKGEVILPGFVASWRAQKKVTWDHKAIPAALVPTIRREEEAGMIVIGIEKVD